MNFSIKCSPNQQRTSPQEWLATFPEAKNDYILPKIRELESAIHELEQSIKQKLHQSRHITDGWFVRELIKSSDVVELIGLKRRLHCLKRYLPQPKTPGRINQDQIERAKDHPILEVAQDHLMNVKRCGVSWRGLCPFHEERTPSFFLYPNTNTFHCFGCQAHGDVIALTQKLMSISFIDAIKHLAPSYES